MLTFAILRLAIPRTVRAIGNSLIIEAVDVAAGVRITTALAGHAERASTDC
jgi:hypothetical protein